MLDRFTIPVDVTGTFDTAIAFFNRNSAPTTLSLKLLDSAGVILGTSSFTLGGKAHRASFVTQLFPGTTNLRGTLTVSASPGVTALTLRQNSPPLSYTTLPAVRGAADGIAQTLTLLPQTLTGINATNDTTANVTLPAGFRLTGTITGSGAPELVNATASNGTMYSGGFNPATRRYLIVLPAGTFNLTVCFAPGSAPSGTAESTFAAGSVQVSADTTRDIVLPVVALTAISGRVTGVGTGSSFLPPSIVFTSADLQNGGTFTLDASGAFQGQLAAGSYTASLSILSFAGTLFQSMGLYNIGSVTVGAAAVVADFAMPQTSRLSGVVRLPSLTSLPLGSSVFASDTTVPTTTTSCIFPPSSSFVSVDATGTYQLVLRTNRPHAATAIVPVIDGTGSVSYPVPGAPVILGADATHDFNLPALPAQRVISGRATDSSGQGVAEVSIIATTSAVTGAANLTFAGVATTDAAGNYRMTVLSGTNYELTFTPPVPSP